MFVKEKKERVKIVTFNKCLMKITKDNTCSVKAMPFSSLDETSVKGRKYSFNNQWPTLDFREVKCRHFCLTISYTQTPRLQLERSHKGNKKDSLSNYLKTFYFNCSSVEIDACSLMIFKNEWYLVHTEYVSRALCSYSYNLLMLLKR